MSKFDHHFIDIYNDHLEKRYAEEISSKFS